MFHRKGHGFLVGASGSGVLAEEDGRYDAREDADCRFGDLSPTLKVD